MSGILTFPFYADASLDHVFENELVKNVLRNRIAHHEPVFQQNHLDLERKLLMVLDWICDDYRTWVESRSRISAVVKLKPFR